MSSGARAAFVPFPTNLDIKEFVNSRENIVFATRITCDSIDEYPLEDFENLVYTHVIRLGKPLVIEGFDERLNQNMFSADWLKTYYGGQGKRTWTWTFPLKLQIADIFAQWIAEIWLASKMKGGLSNIT